MAALTNFYIFLGILAIALIISQASNYSFTKKTVILSMICLILLWIEKPGWFIVFLQSVSRMF